MEDAPPETAACHCQPDNDVPLSEQQPTLPPPMVQQTISSSPPLGPDSSNDLPLTASIPVPIPIPAPLASRLYTSHFLSTWNTRLFEFGSVLFLASIYPSTLLPMSVYALARGAAAIAFSPSLGAWIDRGDRLNVVRASIIGQRVAVAGSCGIFLALENGRDGTTRAGTDGQKGLFALVVLLGCVEKLSSVMNTVAVERDWVVVITEGNEHGRRVLNARIRRIDLFCKLLGPLAISLIDGASTIAAIWTALGMSLLSVAAEYVCIAQAYKLVPSLQRTPLESRTTDVENAADERDSLAVSPGRGNGNSTSLSTHLNNFLPLDSLPFYLRHPAFLPSISLALLYLTVLSFSGQMITFLLASGYNSFHVGAARTVSTIFELSTTWISPRLVRRIGAIRAGIWSLSWQMTWLAAGVSWFFADWAGDGKSSIASISGLVGSVILSRVGLWGYDLAAQNIIQDEVEDEYRGTFSSVEASAQNFFELLSYASTIVFSRPDQFQWPILVSVAAVYCAGGLYTWFVRQRRGHLFHAPPCACIQLKDNDEH